MNKQDQALAEIAKNLRILGWDNLIFPTEQHKLIIGRLLIGRKEWIEAITEYALKLDEEGKIKE